jgi:AraC-like DNA-binding protein
MAASAMRRPFEVLDGHDRSASPAAGTVSPHLVSVLVEAALAAGAGERQVAQVLGRDPAALRDGEIRVPAGDVSRLWQLLYRLAGPRAGVTAAETAGRGRLYVWDYLIANAPTLTTGLRDASWFCPTVSDRSARFEVVADGSLLTVHYVGMPVEEPTDAMTKEFWMTVTVRRAREAFGDAGIPVRVDFSHRAPADRSYLVRALGTENIRFGQGRDAITFLGADEVGVQTNDPVLQQILRSHARLILDSNETGPSAPPGPVVADWPDDVAGEQDSVREAIVSALLEGELTLAGVARRLETSSRTLQRRLHDLGTSWREEVDSVRHEQAVSLIRDTMLPIRSIAVRLGYTDARALRRAFHRWAGQGPDEFRRSLTS